MSMKVKSPREPILLSDESFDDLERMLKRNEMRTTLTKKEKALLEGSKEFDDNIREMLNEQFT